VSPSSIPLASTPKTACRRVRELAIAETRVSVVLRFAFLIAAVASLLRGQTVEGQQPTFRAEVSVVELSAVVVDEAGHAVFDLTAGDFEIVEDGRGWADILEVTMLQALSAVPLERQPFALGFPATGVCPAPVPPALARSSLCIAFSTPSVMAP
jgi:hypothetical protein